MYYDEINFARLVVKYAGKANNITASTLSDSEVAKVADPTTHDIFVVVDDFISNKIVALQLSHYDEDDWREDLTMTSEEAEAILDENEQMLAYERRL